MSEIKGTSEIVHMERLNNSKMGNPRFKIAFKNGLVATTMSDASFSYAICCPDWIGKIAKFVLKEYKSGRRVISDISI